MSTTVALRCIQIEYKVVGVGIYFCDSLIRLYLFCRRKRRGGQFISIARKMAIRRRWGTGQAAIRKNTKVTLGRDCCWVGGKRRIEFNRRRNFLVENNELRWTALVEVGWTAKSNRPTTFSLSPCRSVHFVNSFRFAVNAINLFPWEGAEKERERERER